MPIRQLIDYYSGTDEAYGEGLTLKHRLVEPLLSFFRIRGGRFTHMIWRSSTVNK